ncbi:MAG TPA: YdcF family protein [Thermoleophilia bacterium]|nr:YdcF family protein [Thermoleophilia bacterium]
MTTLDDTMWPEFGRRELRATGRTRESAWGASAWRLWAHAGARGLALFLGLFSLLNLVGELRSSGFDQNIWWLDLRPLPTTPSAIMLALAGALLVCWGLRPATTGWRRPTTAAVAVALGLVATANGITFYRVWEAGQIRPWLPLPLSFVLAVALLFVAWAAVRSQLAPRSRWTPLLIVGAVVLCGLLFPLAQQVFFGKTTYVRPVQVAVVFGAQVHADGHPSMSLVDRVRTAANLYKAGLAQRLLLSGAQGADEPVNETAVMRTLAVGFGVPASAIDLDPSGYNTEATVRDTVPVLRAAGYTSVAVVSDFFHLPRVKLAYQRLGYDVTTVPSQARRIPQTTQLVAREIPAFWVYYLRAVLR